MTIPTSGGEQNASSIYLISDYKIERYINWHNNRPTHSLQILGGIDTDSYNKLRKLFPSGNCFIVLGKNENFATALWEIGYQLFNLLLQAHALHLTYKAILLDEDHKVIFRSLGITDLVAAFLLSHDSKNRKSHERI